MSEDKAIIDDFLISLREMRNNSSDGSEIVQQLLQIQNRAKLVNFQNICSDKIKSIFGDFLLFLLYTSSQTLKNSAISIATNRTAALFIFNLGPFFPKELQESFRTIALVSTIDMTSSSLIASLFSIITYHIAIPYRNDFLIECPIFHHLTQKQMRCPEYFISSLSHYSHLGIEWHRTLVKSFLLKVISDSNDNIYWRAIVAIVTENMELFSDVFDSIIENKIYQINIFFVASLFALIPSLTTTKQKEKSSFLLDKFSLFEIAKFSLTKLENIKEISCNEKCSILKILSFKTRSFQLGISSLTDEKDINGEEIKNKELFLKFNLTNENSSEKIEKILRITDLSGSPEFYFLSSLLPLDLLYPNGEEGSTLLAAKLTSLISYLGTKFSSIDDTNKKKILSIIKKYIDRPYDTTVSACFQGIYTSVHLISDKKTLAKILKMIYNSLFSESMSWFHDMDRLKVIKAFPLDSLVSVYGNYQIFIIFDKVLTWAKEKNDKLALFAQEVIETIISQSDREILIGKVIKSCDIFNSFDFFRTLQILNRYLANNRRTVSLQEFCYTVCQSLSIFCDIPELYIQSMNFLTHFHLKKLRKQTLNICLAVVAASYRMITGTNPVRIKGVDDSLIEEEYQMIEILTSKQALDIMNENLNDYSDFVPPLFATMKLFLSVRGFDPNYVVTIIKFTINVFPKEAVQFMFKFWDLINLNDKIMLLTKHYNILETISDYTCAGLFFELYMKIMYETANNSSDGELQPMTKFLREYIHKSIPFFSQIDDETLLYFLHFYKYTHPKKSFDFGSLPEPKRSRMISLVNNFHDESIDSEESSRNSNFNIHPSGKYYVSLEFKFEKNIYKIITMNQLSLKPANYDDPLLIEVQLRNDCCIFEKDEIQKIYDHFIQLKKNEKNYRKNNGIIISTIEYAKRHHIVLKQEANKDSTLFNEEVKIMNFDVLKTKDKIKKGDLLEFCKSFNDIKANSKIDKNEKEKECLFVLNLISESTKEEKLKLLLIILRNLLNSYEKIQYDTARSVITNFNDNFSKLPKKEVSQTLQTLCQKVSKSGKPTNFINRLLTVLPQQSIGGGYIIESRLLCRDIQNPELNLLIKWFIDNNLPSMYITGIRFLSTITELNHPLNGAVIVDFFHIYFSYISKAILKFEGNEPIHSQISCYLSNVFQNDCYQLIQQNIGVDVLSLTKYSNDAVLETYSSFIPQLIKYYSSLRNVKYNYMESLPTLSSVLPYKDCYFQLLTILIEKEPAIANIKEFLTSEVQSFIDMIEKINFINVEKYIIDWINLLRKYFSFHKTIFLLNPISQIRFNSFFLSIYNYIRLNESQVVDKNKEFLKKWKLQYRSNAFIYAFSKDQELLKASIKLSMFQEDCEETEKIIKQYG